MEMETPTLELVGTNYWRITAWENRASDFCSFLWFFNSGRTNTIKNWDY